MNQTTNLSIRLDTVLKKQAEELFSELGLNMTTAFNLFLRQAVRQRKIPFEIALDMPNTQTIIAMEEAEHISLDPKTKKYTDLSEILSEIKTDEIQY